MKRASTARGRFYDADGKKYPSVTTVLSCIGKPALVAWSANLEREMVIAESTNLYIELMAAGESLDSAQWRQMLLDHLGKKKANQLALSKAGEIGSQAHGLIEWMLRTELGQDVGEAPEIAPEAQYAVTAWTRWRDSVDFRPILVESAVVSHIYGYAGTMDYLCAKIDGVETLCDWKTGKRVYYEAHLQNAAYRVATREMKLGDPKAGLILRLPKTKEDPNFEAVPARDEKECFEAFLAAKALWSDMDKENKWAKEQEERETQRELETLAVFDGL